MKLSLVLFTALISIFILSCRKGPLVDGVNCSGNCFILTGKLIDTARNTGIPDARLKFLVSQGRRGQQYLGETYTDGQGNYNFKFDGTKFHDAFYVVEASKDNMFYAANAPTNVVGSFDLDTVTYNNPFVQNFYLYHPSTLHVRLIADLTNFDRISTTYDYGTGEAGISIKGGRKIDTSFTWKTAGGVPTYIYAHGINFSTNPMVKDTVIVPVYSSANVEVRF